MRHIIRTARALGTRAACVVLALFLAVPATAQTSGPPPSAPPSDASAALAEILRDDAARAALIAELERLATPVAEETAVEAAPSPVRRIAAATQDAAERVADGVAGTLTALRQAPARFDALGADEIGLLLAAFEDLLLVIAATVAAFVVLRLGARLVYRRMGARHREAGPLARWAIVLGAGLVDAAVVLLAWAIGYGVAAMAVGPFGEMAVRQTLYLNAFLAVEMAKVAVRLVIAPNAGDLRLLAIGDGGARRLYRVLNWALSVLGYGVLLLAPIVAANASPEAGRALSALAAILAVAILASAVVRHRTTVARWLLAQGRKPLPPPATAEGTAARAGAPVEEPEPGGLWATLARNWHWAALLWLGWILLTTLARSEAATLGALRLSLALGGGAVLAVALAGALGRAMGRGVSLPARINARLPRLESRLNGFVPQLLQVLRVVVVAAVLVAALWAGGAITPDRLFASEAGLRFAGTALSVLAILAVAFVLWLALTSWVEYRLNPGHGKTPTARERTLLTLLSNAAAIALLVITGMFALSEIGLDIGPLLASAGVIGLAIGFGAQKLVQDVITGVFIQLENAMNVGDIVTAGPTTGVVERLTVRSVSLRDLNGIYHLIPFSAVDAVSNFSRDFSNYVVDMGVAYREDVGEAKEAMFEAFDELKSHPEQGPNIIGDFEWFGLEKFADSAVILRGRIRTLPGKQWGVGRAYNEIVKRIFDARGIEIPFPHTTLYLGENKKGVTQPIRVEELRSQG